MVNRVLITIGPFTIYWYSFLILVAVLIGYHIVLNYCKKINYNSNSIIDMSLFLVLWSVIGARLYYVIFNYSVFKDDFLGIFQVWRGGLAIYGGIIGGVLYIFYYCLKKKINFIKMLDAFSLSLLLGQAIGRWGNFFNGEAYGNVTTYEALKGLHLPEFIIQGMNIDGVYYQPTFLYESIWCLVGVIFLYRIRKKYFNQVGRQVSFYLMWYGFGRFFIEGLRHDSLYLGTLRISQVVSIICFVVGLVGTIYIWKKNHIKISEVTTSDGRI